MTRHRDCPPNGVSGLTRRRGQRGRSPDNRDDLERELDAEEGDETSSRSEAERAAVRELVMAARARGEDLTGPDGLLKAITATVLETALEEELTEHLGHEKHQGSSAGNEQHPQWHQIQDGAH